ncbi:MAG: DUF1501 domain-containing protein [Pirellulales bacterium]
MLSLGSGFQRTCEGASRRDFLRVGALTGLGLSLPNLLAARQKARAAQTPVKDVNCILIWTLGGTSHHDTFDPKPQAPQAVRGEYSFIDTAVPGVQFTEIVPRLARELNRFSLLRSWNPQNGSHGAADQEVMSGRPLNQAMIYPCYGSVVSHQFGFKTALPPFVQLGSYVDHSFGGGVAGYLPMEHNPFEVLADPNAAGFTVRDVTPPGGVDFARVDKRKNMLAAIDSLQRRAERQPAAFGALDEHYKAALNMITSPDTKRAFNIEDEDPRLRERYGRTRFGQNCLLARRLIEGGVRFVTVSDAGWDTHVNNFDSLKNNLIPPIDQALPELLIDLEERGMLDNTLVVWATDFGRTPKINSASGRDHWASAGFVVAAGAGIQGGRVIGRTDDEGGVPTADEYFTRDLGATIFTKLGISPDLILQANDGRPMLLNEGRVIREWM